MKSVRLRSGGSAPESVVRSMAMILERLLESDPVALHELAAACQDETHVLWPGTGKTLAAWKLVRHIRPDGTAEIHDQDRDIVRSAVRVTGGIPVLVDPVAGEDAGGGDG